MAKQQFNDYDYDYDNHINRHLAKIKKCVSQSDYTLIEKYHTQMIISSMTVATQAKNLEIIASLSTMIDQEWNTMTKDNINNLVVNVMRNYSEKGQETHASYDHKKILKLWFRFVLI